MGDNNVVGSLYDRLLENGYVPENLEGSREGFAARMGDARYRRDVYDMLESSQYESDKELATSSYTEFENKYGSPYARSAQEIQAEMRGNAREPERTRQAQEARAQQQVQQPQQQEQEKPVENKDYYDQAIKEGAERYNNASDDEKRRMNGNYTDEEKEVLKTYRRENPGSWATKGSVILSQWDKQIAAQKAEEEERKKEEEETAAFWKELEERPNEEGGYIPTAEEAEGLEQTMRETRQTLKDTDKTEAFVVDKNEQLKENLLRLPKTRYNPETGKSETVYVSKMGNETSNVYDLRKDEELYNELYGQTYDEQMGEQQSNLDDMTGESREKVRQHALTTPDYAAPQALREKEYDPAIVSFAQYHLDKAKEIQDIGEKYKREGVGFLSGAGRGFMDTALDSRSWDFGLQDLAESAVLKRAVDKEEKGGELTREERALLDAVALEMAVKAEYGDVIGRGYKAGQVTGQSLEFMLEMMINPASGIGEGMGKKVAKAVMRRYGEQMLERIGKNAARRAITASAIAGREIGNVIGAAVMTGTTSLPATLADMNNRMTGDMRFEGGEGRPMSRLVYNPDGTVSTENIDGGKRSKVAYSHVENKKDFGRALWEATASQAIEHWSEFQGENLAPLMRGAGKLTQKALDKIGLRSVNNWIDGLSASQFSQAMGNFLRRTQWHGTGGEFAEEIIGGIANALLVGDQTLDTDPQTGLFNKDNLIDTFLGVALQGGFMATLNTVGYSVESIAVDAQIGRKEELARAVWKENGNEGRFEKYVEALDGKADDVLKAVKGVLADKDLTSDEKREALELAGMAMRQRGMEKAHENLMRTADDVNTQTWNAMQEAAATGAELVGQPDENGNMDRDAEGIQEAFGRYNYTQSEVRAMGGDELVRRLDENPQKAMQELRFSGANPAVLQICMGYVRAKSEVSGASAALAHQASDALMAARDDVRKRTAEDGMIHHATLKNGEKVDIVSEGEGTKLVFVVGEDGATRAVSEGDIAARDNMEPARLVLDALDKQARTDAEAEWSQLLHPTLDFQPGDVYDIMGKDGKPVSVTVLGPSVGEGGQEEDFAVRVRYPDGTEENLNKQYVQEKSDEAVMSRTAQEVSEERRQQLAGLMPARAEEMETEPVTTEGQAQEAREATAKSGEPSEGDEPGMNVSYGVGDTVRLVDGDGNVVEGRVQRIDNGKYIVETREPFDGRIVNEFSADQLGSMERAAQAAGIGSVEASNPDEAEGAQGGESALAQIPKTPDGKRDWQKAPSLEVAVDGMIELSGDRGKTKKIAGQLLKKAQKTLKEITEKAGKATEESDADSFEGLLDVENAANAEVEEAQKDVDFYQSVLDEIARREEAEQAQLAEQTEAQGAEEPVVEETPAEEPEEQQPETEEEAKARKRKERGARLTKKYLEEAKAAAEKGKMEDLGTALYGYDQNVRYGAEPTAEEVAEAEKYRKMLKDAGYEIVDWLHREYHEGDRVIADFLPDDGLPEGVAITRRVISPQISKDGKMVQAAKIVVSGGYPESEAENNRRKAELKKKADAIREKKARGEKLTVGEEFTLAADEQLRKIEKKEELVEIWSGNEGASFSTPEGEITITKVDKEDGIVEYELNGKRGAASVGSAERRVENGEWKPVTREVAVAEGSSESGGESAQEAIEAAESEVETEPTPGQIEAGNYKKGHVKVAGYEVTIENPKGSVRRGVDAEGKSWETKMANTYGYIRGTEGVDGDHIDVFLANDMDAWDGKHVYVVDQYNPDGTFDEHKVMLGFGNALEAKKAYLANYEEGWEEGRRIDVSEVEKGEFDKWIESSHRKTKPFTEYKGVEKLTMEGEGKLSIEDGEGKSFGVYYTTPEGEKVLVRNYPDEGDTRKNVEAQLNEDGALEKAADWYKDKVEREDKAQKFIEDNVGRLFEIPGNNFPRRAEIVREDGKTFVNITGSNGITFRHDVDDDFMREHAADIAEGRWKPEGGGPGGAKGEGESPYRLSNETDENGHPFVLSSDGSTTFGEIGEETGLPSAPIKLSEGVITDPESGEGYGLVHIEARHGEQIRKAGYKDVPSFVEDVARNWTKIRKGNKRGGAQTYLLELKDKHNNTLVVELSRDGEYWNINTAAIFNEGYSRKKEEVFSRPAAANQPTATGEVTQSATQKGSEVTETSRDNPSNTSEGKGTTNSGTTKEKGEKDAAAKSLEELRERVSKKVEGTKLSEEKAAKMNLKNFAQSAKGQNEALKCIYYTGGYAYISDGKKAIKVHMDYPKEYEGKAIDVWTGKELGYNYPNVETVLKQMITDKRATRLKNEDVLRDIAIAKDLTKGKSRKGNPITGVAIALDAMPTKISGGYTHKRTYVDAAVFGALEDVIKNADNLEMYTTDEGVIFVADGLEGVVMPLGDISGEYAWLWNAAIQDGKVYTDGDAADIVRYRLESLRGELKATLDAKKKKKLQDEIDMWEKFSREAGTFDELRTMNADDTEKKRREALVKEFLEANVGKKFKRKSRSNAVTIESVNDDGTVTLVVDRGKYGPEEINYRLAEISDEIADGEWTPFDELDEEIAKKQAAKEKAAQTREENKKKKTEETIRRMAEQSEKAEKEVTAALARYEEEKKKNPDAVLIFRNGDGYEIYMDDAKSVSGVIGETPKRRTGADGKTLEVITFPKEALEAYLPKIIKAGHRVGIYDTIGAKKPSEMVTPGGQVEEPKKPASSEKKGKSAGEKIDKPHTRTAAQEKKAKERRQSVESEVRKMTDALGTTVRILDSIDQVRDPNVRKAIEAGEKTGEKVTGWYDPVTGEVVVYYPNLTDVNEAKLTYLHEVVGHKGLRALFGDKFEDTMRDVYRSLPKKLQESIQKRMDSDTFKARGYADPLVASVEEELSNWAEKNKKPSWWDKVVANVRDMIRSVVDLEMTDSDIDYLLWRSRNNLEKQTLQKRATDKVLSERARKANEEARKNGQALFSIRGEKEGGNIGENEKKSVSLQQEDKNKPRYKGWEKRSVEINTSDYEPTDEFRRVQEESRRGNDGMVRLPGEGERSGDVGGHTRERLAGVIQRQLGRAGDAAGKIDGTLGIIGRPDTQFNIRKNVSGKLFHDIFEVVKSQLEGNELVDLHDNYDDCICYLSEDGLSGFAIDKDTGYFTSVFNLDSKRNLVGALKDYLAEQGATYGDCFAASNRPLHHLYERALGVKVAALVDYNLDYDTNGIAAKYDNPQIAFFYYPEGRSGKEVEVMHFDKNGYDDATKYVLSLVSEKPETGKTHFRTKGEPQKMSAKELDKDYFDAMDRGDEERMREIIDEVARRKGYDTDNSWRQYATAPNRDKAKPVGDGTLFAWTLADEVSDNPNRANSLSEAIRHSVDINGSRGESMNAIQDAMSAIRNGEDPMVTIYRAVPKGVKESKMRVGDWVTMSREYAEVHGESIIPGEYRIIGEQVPASQLYWDGNDINEWGFDDGKEYRYKNTKNNRKLNDLVTRDEDGNVIPPSKRFNERNASPLFRTREAEQAHMATQQEGTTQRSRTAGEMAVEALRKKGVEVVTDTEEMQRVLDEARRKGKGGQQMLFAGEHGVLGMIDWEIKLRYLDVARDMEKDGKSAYEIKVVTGWEKGADGKWRYEIPDFGVDLDVLKERVKRVDDGEGNFDNASLTLRDVLKGADKIFNMYPSLRNLKVVVGDAEEMGDMNACYLPKSLTIMVNEALMKGNATEATERVASSLTHEVQHAIQDIEGFSDLGSSWNVMHSTDFEGKRTRAGREVDLWKEREELEKRHEEAVNKYRNSKGRERDKWNKEAMSLSRALQDNVEEINRLEKEIEEKGYEEGHFVYEELATEVEARNAARRRDMLGTARRRTLASETEDVARKDQVILRNGIYYDTDGRAIGKGRQFLKTSDGEILGFVHEGKVYLDPDALDANTPVHEYTHLWDTALRKSNPKLWQEGIELMKQTPLWEQVKNDPNYKDIAGDENLLASEVHSRLTGEEGRKYFEQLAKEADEAKGPFEKAEKISLMEQLRRWIDKALKWAKERLFGKPEMTVEEFRDMPLKDLLDSSAEEKVASPTEEKVTSGVEEEVTSREEAESQAEETEELHTAMRDRVEEMVRELHLGDAVDIRENADGLKGRMARSKGWYDPRTGRMTIILSNNADLYDVEGTIFHEATTHHGLRAMLGKRFDSWLEDVYRNVHKGARVEINEIARKNGWNFKKATEEWLAKMSEDGKFLEAIKTGTWRKVRYSLNDMIRRLGFHVDIGDDELRYALWRSHQNLKEGPRSSILAQATDVAMQSKLQVGNFAPQEEPLLSRERRQAAAAVARDKTLMRDRYERRMRSGWYQSKEALQDSMRSLWEFYKLVRQAQGKKWNGIKDIRDFENAYFGENRLSSVNEDEINEMARRLFAPMYDEVRRLAPTAAAKEKLDEYMLCKHALERNEYMAERNARAAYEKKRKEAKKPGPEWEKLSDAERERRTAKYRGDYAGLTALFPEAETLAEMEGHAEAVVRSYEERHNTESLWKRVNAVNKAILDKQLDSGIISRDVYDKIRGMYKNYIPLRGFEEKTSDEAYAYVNPVQSAFNAPVKAARGRHSKADDPFANMESMAESAVLQGNRNLLVKQRFYDFVKNNPTDLVSESELWLRYDKQKEGWEPVFPDLSGLETGAEISDAIKAFDERMEQLSEENPEEYRKASDPTDVPYRVLSERAMQEHQVLVKVGGKDIVLTVNGSPRLAQALNGKTNPDAEEKTMLGSAIRQLGGINRYLSQVYTTWNPDFIASNFMRDFMYSNTMAWAKEDARYAANFNRNAARINLPRVLTLLDQRRRGRLPKDSKVAQLFDEFMRNGGETGYARMTDSEALKRKIEKEIGGGMSSAAWRGTKAFGQAVAELGRATEINMRFVAYVTSREAGRSVGESIWDAKEMSVNFNKKGAGDRFWRANGQTLAGNVASVVSAYGRAGIVFWNAGIQGVTNIGRVAYNHPWKFLSYVGVPMFVGGLLLAAMHGDDDDYWDIPDYVRRNNVCVKLKDGTYMRYPLTVEYRMMYGLGEILASKLRGKENEANMAMDIVGAISAALPVDMMEGQNEETMESWYKFLAVGLTPSAAKPVVEALSNRSWTGMPLYKETPWNGERPDWTKVYPNTGKGFVWAAKTISNATGGDKYKKGWIDPNPAIWEYVLRGNFPGATFMNEVANTVQVIAGQKDFDWRYVPLMNRVLLNADEPTRDRSLTGQYMNFVKETDRTRDLYNRYMNSWERGEDDDDYEGKVLDMEESDAFARMEIGNMYKSAIKSLYDIANDEALSDAERKEARDAMIEAQKECLEMVRLYDETGDIKAVFEEIKMRESEPD